MLVMENNSAPNQQPIPVSQPPHHFSKTFIILIVVFLIMAVGIGGYVLGANRNQIAQTQPVTQIPQPSPAPIDETANWKTYINDEYEISFKYPPSFVIENTSKPPQFFFSLKSTEEELVFSVEPSNTPSFASRLKSLNTIVKNNISWKVYPESTYCDAGDCSTTSASYETTKGEWRYAFLLRKISPNSDIFEQILSTFQFSP